MTAFHEVRFRTDVSLGARGGPERRTDVVQMRSGFEERNALWANSRRKWNAASGVKTFDQLAAIVEFWEERRARLYGFRWKDQLDFKSCAPGGIPAPIDQKIGIGDGVVKTFQLIKTYGGSFEPWTRVIRKPVAGTVRVATGGAEQSTGWTVDTTTGLVTFTTAPSVGLTVSAGYEFDVPVRFDTDYLEADYSAFQAGAVPSIPVVELLG